MSTHNEYLHLETHDLVARITGVVVRERCSRLLEEVDEGGSGWMSPQKLLGAKNG